MPTKQQTRLDTETSNDMLVLQATYNYGVSLFHLSQDWAYEHAIETFQKLLSGLAQTSVPLHVELRELTRGSLACTYAKLANRKPQQRNYFCDLAFEQTSILLEISSTNKSAKALALTANGLVYLGQAEYDRAIESFKSALEFDNNLIALLGIGESYLKSGRRDEAMDAYQKANQMTSNGGYAAYWLGNLFRQANNKEMAIEAYKHASSISVARLALGKLYLEDEKLEAALEEFRQAVNLNRKSSESLVNIAWTILEMQRADEDLLKECIDAATRSVQIDRGSTNEWHRRTILALSLVAAKKLERALKEAQLALQLAPPNQAQAKFCVALCEFHLGRRDNASTILLEILRSKERGLWRTRAERLMQELQRTKSEN